MRADTNNNEIWTKLKKDNLGTNWKKIRVHLRFNWKPTVPYINGTILQDN